MKPDDTLPGECQVFREEMLEADGPRGPSSAGHGRDCAACREWSRMHDQLIRAAAGARSGDLSAVAVRETRRRAAEILAGSAGNVRAEGRTWGWAWRWASASSVAAAAVLFLGVAVLNRTPRQPAPAAPMGSVPVAPMDLAVLDREIEGLQQKVSRGVAHFEPGYAGLGKRRAADDRIGEVRKRIETSLATLGRELQPDRSHRQVGGDLERQDI